MTKHCYSVVTGGHLEGNVICICICRAISHLLHASASCTPVRKHAYHRQVGGQAGCKPAVGGGPIIIATARVST